MAERDFTYSTTRELPCGCDCGGCSRCTCGTTSREVVVCLIPEIAPPFVTEDDDEIPFDFIDAEVISCCRQERACPPIYSYVLRYDDDNILVDELLPQHVTGVVCRSCEFEYFSALIATGSGVFNLSVTDTASIDLTLAADNLQASIILYDAVANANMATIDADGLLVRPLAVSDTTSINLTVSGFPPAQQTVSGVVIIYDAIANSNMLTIDADGLLVRPLGILDTATIDMVITGTPPAQQIISGNVKISPDAGNTISAHANGIYASAAVLTGDDTTCISVDVTAGVVTATPIISPLPGNLLACVASGLYASVEFGDSCTIALSYNPYNELEGEVVVSSLPDNQLVAICDDPPNNGLYVGPVTTVEWGAIIGYPSDNTDLTDYILELIPCWQNSIVLDGGSGCLELENDELSPGASEYYGTDSGGVKGWFPVAVAATLPITGDGTAGTPLDLLLSADAGNNATLGTDNGLFVPTGAATVSTDFPIIGDGSGGNPVDLLLSADAGNQATLGTDNGLFVPDPSGTVTVDTAFPIIGDGSFGNPIDLLLSSDVGNQATIGTDNGLYVPAVSTVATNQPIIGDGSGGNPVDLLLSTDTGNQATLGTDNGLFIPDPTVSTNLPISGNGSAGNPIDLVLSADVGNVAVLGTDSGLYVPAGAATVSTALPITGDGSGGNPVDLLLSTDVGNSATLGTDNGLFVPTGAATVSTALPITGDGSGGNPVDLLFSADAGNIATSGTDGGVFVSPHPVPSPLIITRTASESGNNGNGISFLLRRQALAAAGTTDSSYLMQVPASWDGTDVEILARLTIDNPGDGGVRFQWGIAAYASGEVVDVVDDQTISFTQSMLGAAADQLIVTTSQVITAANLAVGDFLRLTFRRLGGDGADTQTGSLNLFQVSAQFNRTANFGVTS